MRRLIFFLFLFSFLSVSRVYASDFTTDYNVNYTINNEANTHVNFDVTLTNISEQYYASSYSIRLGFLNVTNVTASDPNGPITPTVTKSSKGQDIELNFNKKAIGLGNKLTFNLAFDTSDVTQNIGSVWEMNIPGLSNQSDFSSFNVNVAYPTFLGKPASIKPDNSNLINRIYGNKISFSKSDLGTSGISIAFGQYQIYSFNLTYHLENNNLFPISTEIALPPQTNYQDVSIESIIPKPNNVKIDKDGNWLAQYSLSPSQKINAIVLGQSKVYLSPKSEKESDRMLSDYLKAQPYWETNDQKVSSVAQKLKTSSAIYQYIVDNLTYDYSRVTDNRSRLGAAKVLRDPISAVCLEFTDAFVALARSAGIPAREVDGFANTKNTQERPLSLVKDVLHAWPEYYDKEKEMWIMVDPTWGNTTNGIDYFNTLDFDHFAFTIKGEDSSYPVPAGGYKTVSDLSTKDVNVQLSSNFKGFSNLLLTAQIPKQTLPGLPVNGKVIVKNDGSMLSDEQEIIINSNYLKPITNNIQIGRIPPFGYVEIPITFKKTNILTNKTDIIKIELGNNSYEQRILISPFVASREIIGGILIVLFISTTIILIKSGRIPLFKQKG